MSARQRLLVVVHTETEEAIRIISARLGTTREKNNMNKEPEIETDEADKEMLPEYEFSNGVRGKYAARYKASSNIVVLDEDVAQAFPTTKSVNQALRLLVQIAQQNVHKQAS